MAGIEDRLERLNRRTELSERVRAAAWSVPAEVAAVGEDFREAVEAAGEVVRRRPGLAVLLAPGDGRQGGLVVRVSVLDGEVRATVVRGPGPGPGP